MEKPLGFPTTGGGWKKKLMRWSEVIMVRSVGSGSKDICIVLFHEGKKTKSGGSRLGLRLVAALQEFSLVHHTVWIEIENEL